MVAHRILCLCPYVNARVCVCRYIYMYVYMHVHIYTRVLYETLLTGISQFMTFILNYVVLSDEAKQKGSRDLFQI